MLGYMTEKQALKHGFSHHGSYYGIPIWIGGIESGGPMVAVKWAPFDFLMDVASVIEGVLFPLVHGADDEPHFMFKVNREIEPQ